MILLLNLRVFLTLHYNNKIEIKNQNLANPELFVPKQNPPTILIPNHNFHQILHQLHKTKIKIKYNINNKFVSNPLSLNPSTICGNRQKYALGYEDRPLKSWL